jgi:hypothetical protein
MSSDTDPGNRIKAILRANPRGLGITEISQKARMHRNITAKYLGILHASGEVDMRKAGMTKIYTLVTVKQVSRKEPDNLHRFRLLARKAAEFRDLPREADIYQVIAEGFREIVPDAAVTVSSFDMATTSITVRALAGDEGVILKHYPETIGANIVVADPQVLALISRDTISPVLGGVHIASLGKIPVVPSARIEEELPVAFICSVSLILRKKFLGAAAIFRRHAGPVTDEELLYAYRDLASLALARRIAEEKEG